jgi:hypothetical protein
LGDFGRDAQFSLTSGRMYHNRWFQKYEETIKRMASCQPINCLCLELSGPPSRAADETRSHILVCCCFVTSVWQINKPNCQITEHSPEACSSLRNIYICALKLAVLVKECPSKSLIATALRPFLQARRSLRYVLARYSTQDLERKPRV